MAKNIKKTSIAIIAFLLPIITFSQKSVDGQFLFKMWFYIEHTNVNLRTENDFPVKDSALFALYETAINLKFDTLENKGFTGDYFFLSIAPMKNNQLVNDSALTYSKTRHLSFLSVPLDYCKGYVLCINSNTGRSFRLQGFYGNDFLSLLKEVKENYYKTNSKNLSVKSFLKEYTVNGIDFSCLYNGLRSGDATKYPCLINCSDLVIVIH